MLVVWNSQLQYSLFIIIDKVTLTDSVNSRRGRKKRGDYQIIITKLTFSSVFLSLYHRDAVDYAANIALLLNYFQGIELFDN